MRNAVTHDSIFHADDVFAGAALRLVYPSIAITRTRDKALIDAADIAFDVGGGCYDHHQIGGNGQRANGIPYAAFGLVWHTLGIHAVCAVLGDAANADVIADEVDRMLVQQVDAADNGVSLHTGELAFADARPVGIGSIIGWMRPTQDERDNGITDDACYEVAVTYAKTILCRAILHARDAVNDRTAIGNALFDADGDPVVVFERYANGWNSALSAHATPIYAVYPSGGTWRCQSVQASPTDSAMRQPLPIEWRGLEGAPLAALTGVEDATFCHRSGFICGAQTRDGAVMLARLALEGGAQ